MSLISEISSFFSF